MNEGPVTTGGQSELPQHNSANQRTNLRVVSWNVNGLRAICAKAGGIFNLLESLDAGEDISVVR